MKFEAYILDRTFADYDNFCYIKSGEGGKIYRFDKVGEPDKEPTSKIYSVMFKSLLKFEWYDRFETWLFFRRKKRFVKKVLGRVYHG